ncbi:MAG TPA: Crp/Fnr family transcriptional regulator [Bryobacteraceae bacterium]|jgi:CRP/FNR family transcriptional regulator|nr:Crp/Fnr family transcriptional regulator [Bryobacteraceae bacterium]
MTGFTKSLEVTNDNNHLDKSVDRSIALRKTELLATVSEPILTELASRAVILSLRAGEVLFSEDDEASGLYIVVDGELRSVRRNAKGREQVLSTERAGAVLAAVPVFAGGRFYTTSIADTQSTVLCIDSQDILKLCNEHTELLWALTRLFARRLRHYAELIEILALRNVEQRVAQYIYNVCQEIGVTGSDACSVEIKMTQSEMASRIGSTREVVCRALAHLQARGLIHMEESRVVKISSLTDLAKFAGGEQDLEEPRVVAEILTEIA